MSKITELLLTMEALSGNATDPTYLQEKIVEAELIMAENFSAGRLAENKYWYSKATYTENNIIEQARFMERIHELDGTMEDLADKIAKRTTPKYGEK